MSVRRAVVEYIEWTRKSGGNGARTVRGKIDKDGRGMSWKSVKRQQDPRLTILVL